MLPPVGCEFASFNPNKLSHVALRRLAGVIPFDLCAIFSSSAVHLLVTLAKFFRPGGARAVAAESLLLKHQLVATT